MRHIVIVGGGFAGVHLARRLRKQKNVWITLINDSDEFRYCPALYRSATGKKMGIARLPLEWMLLDVPNIKMVIGKVAAHNPAAKKVQLESGEKIEYDEVVFAIGVVSTYFNIDGLAERAFGIKSSEEVTKLRHHLHDLLLEDTPQSRNFVIIGGGPTGVELAAGLGASLKKIAKKHRKSRKKIDVWLIEAAPRLLPVMSERAGKIALKRLQKLGVKVQLNTKVTAETKNLLKTSEGPIPTHAVIWTAGTTNNPFFKEHANQFPLNERGKVAVDKHLQVSRNVYVIGDNAATKFSGLALTAVHNGKFVANDIKKRIAKKPRKAFKPLKPIQIIPMTKRSAILQYGKFTFGGFIPSLLRVGADFIGYADIMGPVRAYTIWRSGETNEDNCHICAGRH